jgi:hypothetical protein
MKLMCTYESTQTPGLHHQTCLQDNEPVKTASELQRVPAHRQLRSPNDAATKVSRSFWHHSSHTLRV